MSIKLSGAAARTGNLRKNKCNKQATYENIGGGIKLKQQQSRQQNKVIIVGIEGSIGGKRY